MATKRQIEANRQNAKRSTGPTSIAGRATSSRNAYIHGLTCERESTEQICQLTQTIEVLDLSMNADDAVQLACSRDDLQRIRSVRCSMLAALMQAPDQAHARHIANLERYERAAWAKRKRMLRSLLLRQPIQQ